MSIVCLTTYYQWRLLTNCSSLWSAAIFLLLELSWHSLHMRHCPCCKLCIWFYPAHLAMPLFTFTKRYSSFQWSYYPVVTNINQDYLFVCSLLFFVFCMWVSSLCRLVCSSAVLTSSTNVVLIQPQSEDISDAAMNKDITVVQYLHPGYNSIYQYFKHFDY